MSLVLLKRYRSQTGNKNEEVYILYDLLNDIRLCNRQFLVTSMKVKRKCVERMDFNKVINFILNNARPNDQNHTLVMIGLIKIILSKPTSNITTLFKLDILKDFTNLPIKSFILSHNIFNKGSCDICYHVGSMIIGSCII